jgi:peroxiredoxin Q/BCP
MTQNPSNISSTYLRDATLGLVFFALESKGIAIDCTPRLLKECPMLEVGAKVPAFSLNDQHGKSVSNTSLKGTPYLLYFYPKDDTPGCTKEACGFNNMLPDFEQLGLKVFGVSADSEASHAKFAKKYSLNFQLLSDPERSLIEAMGVWVEKSMYGKKYMGIARASFLIDAQGKVQKVWPKVSPEKHPAEVKAAMG